MSAPELFQAMIVGLESAGLTRSEIAQRAGISRMTVWRLAVGDGRQPAYQTIQRIEALKAKVSRP
ncbi:hypothetical protein ASC97_15470 [Rhizobium sp. Root1203]|nr:hypothetical protein ASC97_15470 [Rhizobium sp. Root1203]